MNQMHYESVTWLYGQNVSIVLTSAVETSGDGVQEGVLRGQEALHHRHVDPDVGQPTAGWTSHHPRSEAEALLDGCLNVGRTF